MKARTERSSAPGPGRRSLEEVAITARCGRFRVTRSPNTPTSYILWARDPGVGKERREKEAFVEQAF